MKATNIYLHFDGKCRDAMTFYGTCLGGEPNFTPFAAGPNEKASDRIMHAELHSGPVVLMAADLAQGTPFYPGNNFSISITCESTEEMERIFSALSESGRIIMAPHDAFWGGRFGMLTDQFGISWMLSFR